jgi:hypothetical protein
VSLIHRPCVYCGKIDTNNFHENGHDLCYNGLDRIDSSKGYSENNVVPCCWKCNRSKANMPLHEYLQYLDTIVAWRLERQMIFEKLEP